jgi:hypothetical protein
MTEPPIEIEGYDILEEIGRGGMGRVYLAVQRSLNRRVAVKVLSSHLSEDLGFRARFRREAEVQSNLDHPNVVGVYDFGEVDGKLYLVLQYIEGDNLREILKREELAPERTIELLEQAAAALDATHAVELVHRDVKPHNILVSPGGRAYLADFGLTRTATDTSLTPSGQVAGTVQYIAPEQIAGGVPTSAADVYALSAVLYECLTGVVPFPRGATMAILFAHTHEPPPRASALRPELPSTLDDVIVRGMAKVPAGRPRSAGLLVALARSALGDGSSTVVSGIGLAFPDMPDRASTSDEPGSSADEVPASPASRTVSRRARAVLVVLAVVAVAAGVLVGRAGLAAHAAPAARTAGVANARLGLRYAAPWQRTSPATIPGGLALRDTIALRHGDDGLRLTAGIGQVQGATLLPSDLRARLSGDVAPDDRVLIGGHGAIRYTDLSVVGSPVHMTLLAVPTSDGVAYVVCESTSALSARKQSACDAVAQTLRVRGRQAVALAPDPGYGKALSAQLDTLDAGRSAALSSLRRAKVRGAQVRALQGFRAPCAKVESTVRAMEPGPQIALPHHGVVAAVRGLCDAYSALARAAGEPDAPAYDAARARERSAVRAVRSAVAALAQGGYDV